MSDPSRLPLRFDIRELAGSVGDFGTILPLILAVAAVSHLNTGYILLFFSIWFIISGLYYHLPIPVEPMKAIAVVAIAEGLTGGEIAAAGLILGILFLILSFGNWMGVLENYIPKSVTRGVQLGLALILLRTSGTFALGDPYFFLAGVGIVVLFFIFARWKNLPDLSALILIVIALVVGIALHGLPGFTFLSPPELVFPGFPDVVTAFSVVVVPQALLTLTNAILATALLSADLFSPGVTSKRLSRTIGLMNLTSVPFGGFPMCHGAGGLAGQYRFGARTGGANIYAGIILLAIAALFAGPAVLNLISGGFYGALLVFVALELARYAIKSDSLPVTALIGILSLMSSITIAFFIGLAVAYLIPYIKGKWRGKTAEVSRPG